MNTLDETVPSATDTVTPLSEGYQPTITEIDAAERFADYATVIQYGSATRRSDDVTDGSTWRYAGRVRVVPRLMTFFIVLPDESHEGDLFNLEDVVREVKAGHWNAYPWVEHYSVKHPGTTWSSIGISYRVPSHRNPRLGQAIFRCDDVACDSYGGHHLFDAGHPEGVLHERAAEVVSSDYGFEVLRVEAEDWKLAITVDEDLDEATLSRFAGDVEWMRQTVRNLNEARRAVGQEAA